MPVGGGSRGPSVLGWGPDLGGRVLGWLLGWGPDLGGSRPIWGGCREEGRGGRVSYNMSPLYIPTRASARGLASYLGP